MKKFLLEKTSPELIKKRAKFYDSLKRYRWDVYSELNNQRIDHWDDLRESLLKISTNNFSFCKYVRIIELKYSSHPLCTRGSIKGFGGRFNIGDFNPAIPQFQCLYIAENEETARVETLGKPYGKDITIHEHLLKTPESFSTISLSGSLDSIIDLSNSKALKPITKILKTFKFSDALIREGKNLKNQIPSQKVITDHKILYKSLLAHGWQGIPNNWLVPANSQIFGEIVKSSGIAGIIYPSSRKKNKNSGKNLAIFPSNFKQTDSYIKIHGEAPHKNTPTKIDGSNYHLCEKDFKYLNGSKI